MTASLRVSSAEREQVIEHLKRAYAEGRLDHAELDMRVGLALTGKTRRDLDPLLADLPPTVVWAAQIPAPRGQLAAARSVTRDAGTVYGKGSSSVGTRPDARHGARRARAVLTALAVLLVAGVTVLLASYLLVALISAAMSLHLIK
ncbi:MAG TPA: DUF1707 domain-containing protein [Streptosporangiaceae bacterium]|nr:DUF1707 domain-containing protein [Streptosporangiaceae bacterium]